MNSLPLRRFVPYLSKAFFAFQAARPWFNPRDGSYSKSFSVGPAHRHVFEASDTLDWVLHLYRSASP
jgi:hypothetical protein